VAVEMTVNEMAKTQGSHSRHCLWEEVHNDLQIKHNVCHMEINNMEGK
jgi:hypothetical protein